MLHPYTQIEMIHSFQVEKRAELLKLRQGRRGRPSQPAQVLYEIGRLLVRAGYGLQQRVEPRFNG
jgi:hypothetical protein